MSSVVKTTQHKVQNLDALPEFLDEARRQGRRVVQCHGVFDLLHIGHIRHFEEAKSMGDVLVVTITPDRYVNKGPNRPAFTETLRAEALSALDCIDFVAINQWPDSVETIKIVRPDVYVKGSEYKDAENDITGKIVDEEAAVSAVGGRIAFTEDIVFSSTNLINNHMPVFPPEIHDYLRGFSQRHSIGDVLGLLDSARDLKVLVVGETIIDEYHLCDMIGASTKEPIIATRYMSTEKYAGGIVAVANHVANFSQNVTMLTTLGEQNPQEDFVRGQLNPKVEPVFLYKKDSPTIVKRRFLESYLFQKLFEVYEFNDADLDAEQSDELCARLSESLPNFDVVIVVDYGHGMMTKDAIDLVCGEAKFLAVNTQSNAGNRGFNTISKYPRADFVCLAQHEISLEERQRGNNNREKILRVADKLSCPRVMVTLGKDGNIAYHRDEGLGKEFVEVPALANQVVDRVGAGDAVLSLVSLCVAQDSPMEIAAFIGNAVGAHAVATLGHRNSVERASLHKHLESMLK